MKLISFEERIQLIFEENKKRKACVYLLFNSLNVKYSCFNRMVSLIYLLVTLCHIIVDRIKIFDLIVVK